MLKKALSFALLILAITFSFTSLKPNSSVDTSFLGSFSTDKALSHLKIISEAPHHVGADNHYVVMSYLVSKLEDLGFEVEIQEGYTMSKWGNLTKAKNVIGRLKGANNSKALLVLSHYDSNPHSSYGASDAGSGVVTILEGVRAFLSENESINNDLIVMFTDAEELGLNGADLFVNNHRWAQDIGLVLNFEARGSGGPSYMLVETNGGNSKLIDAFAEANLKYPVANSLAYSIYKLLPNDTDLTRFREDGNIDGFNFAFIDDHFDYHTALDRYDRLDRSSLKHQASYLMPLLSYFSSTDLSSLKSDSDKVYFNVPCFGIISYKFAFILPMLIIACLLFMYLINKGLRNYKLSKTEIFRGFVPMFIALTVNVLIGYLGWRILNFIYPQYGEILQGFTYNGHLYIWSFSLLALGVCFYTYHKFYKPRNAGSLLVAPLFLWLIIAIVLSIFLKGAAFFVIPVIFALIILYIHTRQRQPNLYLLTILSFPLVMIMSPFIKMFPVGLGLKLLMASTLMVTLIFVLLIPILAVFRRKKLWAMVSFIACFVFLFIAQIRSNFNKERPKPNSLVYVLDADDSTAVWATYDKLLDNWTQPFITEDASSADSLNTNGLASKYASTFSYIKKADLAPINPPEISILSDTIIADKRYLRLYFLPKRDINRIEVFADKTNEFLQFKVNSLSIKKGKSNETVFENRRNNRLFTYHIADEPYLDMEFITPAYQNTSFTFYEASYDLLTSPKFTVPERTEAMIPKPFVLNDAVLIKKSITLKPDLSFINNNN